MAMTDRHNSEHYLDPTAAAAIANCEKSGAHLPAEVFTVTIPGRFPDLNDMIKLAKAGHGSYQPYAIDKRRNTNTVAWLCKAAHAPKMRRVSVKITWYEPDARRDQDNISAAAKYIMDGLVLASVIPDDRQKYVAGIAHAWAVDKENPRVVVEIEEAGT